MPNVGIEIPKKVSGQPVTAEEWNRLVEAVNLIRNVRGDEKYIAADAIGGSLVIRYKRQVQMLSSCLKQVCVH
jgi:hypothetical protein